MFNKPPSRPPVGRQAATPSRKRQKPGAARPPSPQPASPQPGDGTALPHERDESTDATAVAPDPVIAQADRDIRSGQVDTDMRATGGLDAKRRARLVPGAGGKPAAPGD